MTAPGIYSRLLRSCVRCVRQTHAGFQAVSEEKTAAIHDGPVGNDHTAQWRIYTDLGRKSAVQVRP